MRRIGLLDAFEVPESWRGPHERAYRKAAAEAKIPDRWLGVADAERAVKACVDPAIRLQVEGLEWDPKALEWTPFRTTPWVAQEPANCQKSQNGEVF